MRALILSYSDCPHYLLATTLCGKGKADTLTLLKDASGRPLRFASLYAAKRYWQAEGFSEAWLVSQSPYDEMIGNSKPVHHEMHMPLAPPKQA
ncbi:MAG TPA: DUF6482 family protein [Cellvibrionaceae bacterium]